MTAPHPEAALSAYEPARRFAVATWGEAWATAEMNSLLKFSDYVRICERRDASSRLKPGEPGAFQEALDAIREAIRVNDGDTLSRLTPDNFTIWAATGSWSHPARVNLGHLRALSTAHTATAGDGGETEEELDERIARQGARENMRLIDSISDLIGLPHNVELELHHVRDALALATPSPAQEPGTGDTGEIVAAFREAQEARDDAGFVGTVADCIRFFATPATTAETRGPAEGAR